MALDTIWKEKRTQKVEKYVKKKMQDWEALVAPHLERITWEWHPMFHIFTIVPLLPGVLP
jgi:hypothetical protein